MCKLYEDVVPVLRLQKAGVSLFIHGPFSMYLNQ